MLNWVCPTCRVNMEAAPNEQACPHCGQNWRRVQNLWLPADAEEPEGFDRAAVERLWALKDHFWVWERALLLERRLSQLGPGSSAVELDAAQGQCFPA